jgi:alanyl-tRNA synthetase
VDTDAQDRIEALVNERIRDNIDVSMVEMNAEEALRSGAMALFEEKYGDRVRVIHLDEFSRELCGGTHTSRTGDIGIFKIISESSVASGVRRIEALTGESALHYLQNSMRILNDSAGLVKDRPEGLYKRIESLIAAQKSLEKELDRLKIKLAAQSADQANQEIKTINNVKVLARCVDAQSPNVLRDLADQFRDKIQSGIVVLGAKTDAKALLIAVVTKDLLGRFHAGNIIKAIAAEVGGKGGGRPDMAQAGGPDVAKLDKAIEKVFEVVSAGG